MAGPTYSGGYLYDKTGNTIIYTWLGSSPSMFTVADVINTQEAIAADITEVSNTIGGAPLNNNIVLENIMDENTGYVYLYDVTPEATAETITGFYLNGTEYEFGGGGGTEYHAGEGISIGDASMNARKGPAPDGFHVPSIAEWRGVKTIMDGLSLTTGDNWRVNLHIPFAGARNYDTSETMGQNDYTDLWSSTPNGKYARYLFLDSSNISADSDNHRAYGFSIRCFKNSFETPTSSWTVINGTLGSAGIFWNQSKGLISITSNGNTGYTIQDKNLGATTVYNNGDTLNEANCGKYYQWGNNYGFAWTLSVTKSSTQVNASSYGPTNPYSSDTFITGSSDWSSVQNDDLRGDTTGTITQENVISNTGVLSVNGQTGNVTVQSGSEASGVTTTQPSNPVAGSTYYDTTAGTLKVYNGTSWVEVGGGGSIIEYVTEDEYQQLLPGALTDGKDYVIVRSDNSNDYKLYAEIIQMTADNALTELNSATGYYFDYFNNTYMKSDNSYYVGRNIYVQNSYSYEWKVYDFASHTYKSVSGMKGTFIKYNKSGTYNHTFTKDVIS